MDPKSQVYIAALFLSQSSFVFTLAQLAERFTRRSGSDTILVSDDTFQKWALLPKIPSLCAQKWHFESGNENSEPTYIKPKQPPK